MKKFLLLGFMLTLAFTFSESWAQERTVSGKVTSIDDGTALPGVNVVLKGTTTGTVTDIDGNFTLTLPTGEGTLVFSFIGLATEEISVGSRSVIDVQMSQDVQQLSEVVVTAQSIEREKRELGYSITSIGGEELTKARDVNVVNSLSGKIPGVQVTSSGGTLGGSTNILIRGASSLTGDNQPLFIVDGVPLSNQNISSGSRITGTIDTGNRAGDINSDDIASVSVLKGAAAAALYGQRAKNGVILITTKRGKKGKGQIAFNSSYRFDNVLKLPDFQNEYAAGDRGKYRSNSLNGWGPRIAGQTVEDFNGEEVVLQAYPDNLKDFYETGRTAINSLSFSGGSETADYRLGLTSLNSKGVTPNSELDRITVSLNAGTKVTEKITARTSLSYTRTSSIGRPAQGGNDPNVLTSIVTTLPRTFDISGRLKDYLNEDGTQKQLDQFTNNPYWIANENPFTNELDRVFGNFEVNYEPIENLTITSRVGTDFYTEYRRRINRKGTVGRENGNFTDTWIQYNQLNTDIMVSYTKDLTEDLNLTALLGHNFNQISTRTNGITAAELTVDQLYNVANATATTPTNSYSRRRLYGYYANLILGFRDYLFLELTGRNDHSSTLPDDNNSYYYPSANLSLVFTEAFDISNNILSYGKLRVNYAQVGSDEQPYQLDFRYFPISTIFGQYGTGNSFPYGGQTSFISTSVIPPLNLEPQKQTQYEIGGEFQFLDGRIGLDVTYYDIRTSNQILSIPVPESTGFSFKRINVGETSNKGIELLLSADIIRTPNLSWNMTAVFSKNRNEVVELAEGVEEIVIESAFNGLQVRAEPGETLGLYGVGFLRDSVSGEPIIDPNTGLRQTGDQERFGDIYPEFNLGLTNTVSYKGISLSFLLDWRNGGVLYSQTVQNVRSAGVAEETLDNREGIFIDRGVIVNDDGTTRPNDVPVQDMQSFWQRYTSGNIVEGGIFDASYIKLREISLSYSLPSSLLENTPINGVSIGVEARNLAILYSKVPHIDPETNLFGSGSNGAAVEFNNIPSTRSFGANLKITF